MELLYTLFLGLCLKGSLQEVRVYGEILENAEMLCDSFKVRYIVIDILCLLTASTHRQVNNLVKNFIFSEYTWKF